MIEPLSQNPTCNPFCRACHYKDLSYDTQLERKNAWAQKQLAQWSDVLKPITPAPPKERFEYRSKTWMRSQMLESGRLSFGMLRSFFNGEKWEKELISWDHCPLHSRSINETASSVGGLLSSEFPNFSKNSLMGLWIAAPHVVLVSKDPPPRELKSTNWSQTLKAPFQHLWFHENPQVGRKIWSHHPIEALYSATPLKPQDVHPIRAFRQNAKTLLIQARHQAIAHLLSRSSQAVLDLYCGTGDLSELIPDEIGWIGIEISQDAAKFSETLRPKSALHQAYVGAVEHRLSDPKLIEKIPESYALFINPPRPGIHLEAIRKLDALFSKNAPQTIAYLSCSASSLARDLTFFESKGYKIKSLEPFDFFPQTEHFETLALLT